MMLLSSAAPSVIFMPPGPLVLRLDQETLQLRQCDVHQRAFGRLGGNGLSPSFRLGGLGRIRFGEAQVGMAVSGMGALLFALPALCCGRGRPLQLAWRSALGPRRAGPARRRRSRCCGVIGLSGSSGPMLSVSRRVRRSSRVRESRGSSLGGGGGLLGQHRFGNRQFRVAADRFGLPSSQPDRKRGLRQLPLLAICRGFPRACRGDESVIAGRAVEVVVPLQGAIGVRPCSYSVRRSWLQTCLSYHLHVRRWCALGGALQCQGGGKGGSWWKPRLVMGQWSSTGIWGGGGRAIWPAHCATPPDPRRGLGLWDLEGRRALPEAAEQGGPP